MNLLTSLNYLAHRQDENFMTEAFVYLLKFLQEKEPSAAVELIKKLTGDHLNIPVDKCRDVTLTTQVHTDEGRPDIEIRTPDSLVYIEVKAESGLGATQLKRYRTALKNSGYENTLLCLLTQYAVDDGAGAVDDKPLVFLRWFQLYEFLAVLSVESEVGFHVVKQFMGFLEDKGIVMEHVSWQLIEGVKSLQNLLNMLGTAIEGNGIKSMPLKGGKSFIGYYTDEKNNWLGILYENPQVLQIQIMSKKEFLEKDLKSLSYTEDDLYSPNAIFEYVDLASEDSHFFARDRTSQLRFLEKQIKDWRKREQKLREMGY